MRPGWKTTEFWISLATSVVGMLGVFGVGLSPHVQSGAQLAGGAAAAAASAAYAISRGLAKRAPAPPATVVAVKP